MVLGPAGFQGRLGLQGLCSTMLNLAWCIWCFRPKDVHRSPASGGRVPVARAARPGVDDDSEPEIGCICGYTCGTEKVSNRDCTRECAYAYGETHLCRPWQDTWTAFLVIGCMRGNEVSVSLRCQFPVCKPPHSLRVEAREAASPCSGSMKGTQHAAKAACMQRFHRRS